MTTIFGRSLGAFCTPHLWKDPAQMHQHCAGKFLHHVEGEGRNATRFKARCTCPCHLTDTQIIDAVRDKFPQHQPPEQGQKEKEAPCR